MGKIIHGMCRTPIHRTWLGMISRCENPKNPAFPNYGGRGIKVCDRWKTFSNFLDDVGSPPDGLSLDRIDNDAGYKPENCRWADRRTQARNLRGRRMLTANGQTKSLAEWSDETGISIRTLWQRLNKGWTDQEAVMTPIVRNRVGLKRGTLLRNYQ